MRRDILIHPIYNLPMKASPPIAQEPWAKRFTSDPLIMSAASVLLLWASFAPLAWWPLAFVAPIGWLFLISAKQMNARQPRFLSFLGRPYVILYLGGFAYWMMTMQFLRLPHPAGYAGWIALSFYLGFYAPVFVAISRVAVHRMKIPLAVAAPMVWVGLELVRGYLITGFSMVLLGHALLPLPLLVQLADIAGAYLVSFVVVAVASLLVMAVTSNQLRWQVAFPLLAALLIVGMAGYGSWRLTTLEPSVSLPQANKKPTAIEVVLIQGSIDTTFDDPAQLTIDTFQQYCDLTIQAREKYPDATLFVWPESSFPAEDILWDDESWRPTGEASPDDRVAPIAPFAKGAMKWEGPNTRITPNSQLNHHDIVMLLGAQTLRGDSKTEQITAIYNSALLVGRNNRVIDRYFKEHRVLFGEYIPLGDVFPSLYSLAPISMGLTPGTEPRSFSVHGVRIAPNICFESTVPHVIHKHVNYLNNAGETPDVLVNVTNDGWFYGAAVLDYHLACNQFRAIEHRTPVLVAANTGFSAVIDSGGRVLEQGKRRDTDLLAAHVSPRAPGRTIYQRIGDIPSYLCLAFCGLCMLFAAYNRFRNKPASAGWKSPE